MAAVTAAPRGATVRPDRGSERLLLIYKGRRDLILARRDAVRTYAERTALAAGAVFADLPSKTISRNSLSHALSGASKSIRPSRCSRPCWAFGRMKRWAPW